MAPPLSWTPIWLQCSDVEAVINKATLLACFDDGNGNFESSALVSIIGEAEVEVLSYLDDYGPPPFSTQQLATLSADFFLRSCALEYVKVLVFDRHPEYVRANGKEQVRRREAFEAKMKRVKDARQRPPQVAATPANVGGAVVDNGPRIYADNADGTPNSGDY